MIHWMASLWVVAEPTGLGDMAAQALDGLQRDRAAVDSTRLILIAAGFVAVVVLVGLLCRCSESRRRAAVFHSPYRLFLALARAHRLGIRDSWLLWRTARAHQLDDPARVFLEPDRLDPQGLPRHLARHAGRLEGLKNRLFVDLGELAQPPRSP